MRLGPLKRGSSAAAIVGSLIGSAVGQTSLVITGVIVARSLGVTDRGYLALLALIPIILAQLGSLGLPIALAYFVSTDPRRARASFDRILPVALAQAALLAVLHAAILSLVLPGQKPSVVVAGLATLPMAPVILWCQYGLAVLQGQQDFRRLTFLTVLPAVTWCAAVLAVVLTTRAGLPEVTIAWVGAYVVAGVISVSIVVRRLPSDTGHGALAGRREMLRFGAAGLIGSASPIERFKLDQASAGLLLSPAALGLHVVATSFTTLIVLISNGLAAIALPRVAASPTAEARRGALWRFFFVSMAICGAVFIALEIAAGWLVPTLFGEDYRDAILITRILLLAALLFAARRVLADLARASGDPLHGTIAEVAAIVALLVSVVILTPTFGLAGLACAMVISSTIGFAAILWLVKSRRVEPPTPVDSPTPEPVAVPNP